MKKIKLFSLLMALICATSLWAEQTWTSGTCTVTFENGVLTVAPTNGVSGAMEDYITHPWEAYEEAITSVVVTDGVTRIGNAAFESTNVYNVTIGKDVKELGDWAFADCLALTSISLPEGLTSIGASAFNNSSILSVVELPESLETINASAFENCTSLTWFTIPENVRSIGSNAFKNCYNITSVHCYATASDLEWDYDSGNIEFKDDKATLCHVYPEQLSAYQAKFPDINLTFVGNLVHSWTSGTCTVTLEDGVLTAAPTDGVSGAMDSYYASSETPWYNYRDDVNRIVVEDGVTKIESYDFGYMNASTLSLGEDLTEIKSSAFENCTQLKGVVIPASVNSINHDAFAGCNNLTSLSIMSEGSVYIGENAFSDCSELNYIRIKASTLNIKKGVFKSCNEVSVIYLYADANNVTWVKDDNLNDSFKTDEEDRTLCHVYADQLEAYQNKFPDINVVFVGDLVRTWTSGTCTVTLEDGVLTVAPTNGVSGAMGTETDDNPWKDNFDQITSIVVADGVQSIKNNAFENCEFATSASIGKDVISIGDRAFENCNELTTITIPVGVKTIGDNAFSLCEDMTDVYCYPNAADLEWEVANDDFNEDGNTRCHVFADQLSAYQNKFPGINVTFVGDLDAEPEVVPDLSETMSAEEISDFIAAHDGEQMAEVNIQRVIYCNNYYNTLCLPFDMNAAQIAASSLNGAEIKAFTGAEVVDDVLHLSLTPVNAIEAGKPYFIKYSNAETLNLLNFINVGINQAEPEGVTFNGVTLQGTYTGFNMPAQTEDNHSYLFLGQNNVLYWPNVAGKIKAFRAYFIVETGSIHGAPRKGMPAVFEEINVATGIDNVQGDKLQCSKLLRDGQLLIIRGEKEFNVQGQMLK